nr:hypothetical protein Iba_chr08dCG6690 [Ipomoea batatas]
MGKDTKSSPGSQCDGPGLQDTILYSELLVADKLGGVIVDSPCNASPHFSIFILAIPCVHIGKHQTNTSGVLMKWSGADQGNRNLTLSAQEHILDRFPFAYAGSSLSTPSAAAALSRNWAIRQAIRCPSTPHPWATGNRNNKATATTM